MEAEKKIKFLQMFYAGALADAVLRLGREEVLDKVTAEKRKEQLATGKVKAQQLGIQSIEQVFEVLPEIFNCSNWKVEKRIDGFKAEATNCMLCALAKKLGAQSPCNIYCIDAMEGIVKGIDPNAEYIVESTLWNDDKCMISIKN